MAFDFVGLTPGYIDSTAIGLPAGDAGSIMLVGISYALVVLLAKFVLISVRIGIATAPELFNETLALVVGLQLLKGLPFFVSDDVGNVFVLPILVSLLEFRLDVALLFRRILTLTGLGLLSQARGHGKSKG
jgi:hypothetical protein